MKRNTPIPSPATTHETRVIGCTQDGNALHDDLVAAEVAVALTYNRHSHVVMMATPADLEDFAAGFSLTEGIIGHTSELPGIAVIDRKDGLEIACTISAERFANLARQRRNLVGRTGCGLCGAESLEQAMRTPAVVNSRMTTTSTAVQAAVAGLDMRQPLQAATGAVHGAAWCDGEGKILVLREDVGRHNALDKLIGHLFRAGIDPGMGFVVISSRASYEMIYKAAAAGIEIVVAVSAPTRLAVDYAHRSGITLVGFARPGRHNIYTFERRVLDARRP